VFASASPPICSVSRNDSFLKISTPPIPPFSKGGLRGGFEEPGRFGFMQLKVAAKARGREGVET